MSCQRCGWCGGPVGEISSRVENWPDNLPPPPPIPGYDPHPPGTCSSPFRIGDKVVWSGGGMADDLPPLRGEFAKLRSFDGPDYTLEEGIWKKVADATPSVGFVKFDKSSITPAHQKLFAPEINEEIYPVAVGDLTSATKWPTVVIA